MEYLYINPDTREVFYPVYIHNFSRSMPNMVRIMGSIKLNPDDTNYPDKKWVKIKDLKEVIEVEFTPELIESKSF